MHLLLSERNVFLSGAAGTGKSFLLRQFLQGRPQKTHPVLASTGTAALLINGRTFHSFFGLGILEGGREATVARVCTRGRSLSRIRSAECIIIDEISMLSGETIATAEEIARIARQDNSPWGGLRIIAVGDFAQLPPVQSGGGQCDWAFMHPVWKASQFQSIFLRTPVRSTESGLLSVLSSIRCGHLTDDVRMFLDRRLYDGQAHFEGTRLFPRRNAADAYNHKRLEMIPSASHSFTTQYSGEARSIEQLKKQCPIPEVLTLKEGALVMLRKNDAKFPYAYVNGSLGTVVHIAQQCITIQLLSGKSIDIEPEKFALLDGSGSERACAINFPLSLAWGTTIHKAQGASIDRLLVQVSGLWESGHAYVALSRATSEEGLCIDHWDSRSIFIDPAVKQFYEDVEQEWDTHAASLPDTPPKPVEPSAKPKQALHAKAHHLQTAQYVKEKLSLPEIAQILGWKEATIMSHIEKLLTQEYADVDIAYLRPPAKVYDPIATAFNDLGTEYLKPVYEACDGKYSYEELRLVRLFLL